MIPIFAGNPAGKYPSRAKIQPPDGFATSTRTASAWRVSRRRSFVASKGRGIVAQSECRLVITVENTGWPSFTSTPHLIQC